MNTRREEVTMVSRLALSCDTTEFATDSLNRCIPGVGTLDHPLFLITYPYIAYCMGACIKKGS